jgi:hypothetical protein
MGVVLAVVLAVFVLAHGGLVAGLAARGRWRAALGAALVPPLAPWRGWRAGMRRRALAWLGAIAIYALGTIAGQLLSGP